MAQQDTHEVGSEYSTTISTARMQHSSTFTVEADSISEVREAVKNAEGLGFELEQALFSGHWVVQNRNTYDHHETVFIDGSSKPVLGVGRSWLKVPVDGIVDRVKPAGATSVKDAGSLTLQFTRSD